MTIETLHYHFGQASYRIQFDVIPLIEGSSDSDMQPRFRASLIRVKQLGSEGSLQYFSYARDFETLIEARKVTSEHAKSLVRRKYLKDRARQKQRGK